MVFYIKSAKLPFNKVAKFIKNFQEFTGSMKKKKFLDSVNIAQKIIKGNSTYEQEKNRLDINKKLVSFIDKNNNFLRIFFFYYYLFLHLKNNI